MSFPSEQPHVFIALIFQGTAHCHNPDDKQCKVFTTMTASNLTDLKFIISL